MKKSRGVSVPSEWENQKHKPMVTTRGDSSKIGKSGQDLAQDHNMGRKAKRRARLRGLLDKARKRK